jgi:hypothetical protein
MPEEKKYYEGIYQVRVLSDRPQGSVWAPEDLAVLLGECYSGDFVGEILTERCTEVTPIHMAELLSAAGSEPDFLGAPDVAQLVEDLADSADDTGCADDLIVASKAALNPLLEGVGLADRTFDEEES